MVSFEIHQKFKGHFLNELRVSFKGSFLEEFKELKMFFFTKINSFKKQLLIEHKMSQGTSQSSEIAHLNGKDKVIGSLLCQLSKRDNILLDVLLQKGKQLLYKLQKLEV